MGVEVTEHWQRDKRLLYVLNHTNQEKVLDLNKRFRDLLSRSSLLEGSVLMAPYDVLILVEEYE